MNKDKLCFLLLAVLQVADWVFTVVGISRFGTAVEGNWLFQYLFQHFHWFGVITSFKLLLFFAAFYLYRTERHGAIRLATAYYGVVMVGPWIYFLSTGNS